MTQLQKGLSRYTLVMVVIGSCLGSGIFLTPSKIADTLGDPWLILLVWSVGGLIALTGALTFAEIASQFPKAGGLYVFIREAFGRIPAFLYGWSVFTVSTTGAIAALSLGFAKYVNYLFPMPEMAQIILAIGAIVFVTVINALGLKFADLFTNIITGLKILGIGLVIGIGVFLGSSEVSFGVEAATAQPESLVTALGLAMVGVVFAYGGFHHASYVAGEAKNAKRNVPQAMIIGVLVITGIYVLTNLSYLYLLPTLEIATSGSLAADAVSKVLVGGGGLVAIIIALSTFGTTGVYTLTAPRIYFAMAKDGNFIPGIDKIHPKTKTPVNAILLQSGWAIVLLLIWKTFHDLVTFTVFVDWMFLSLAAISIFVFRMRKSKEDRAFSVPLYPITPLFMTLVSLFVLVVILIEEPTHAITGLLFLAIGIPFWLLFRYMHNNRKTAVDQEIEED